MGKTNAAGTATPNRAASWWIAAVVALALIPVVWIFYGAWYSNALYQHGDLPRAIFFIVASLCTAGIFVLIRFVIRPEPILFCGPSISTPDAAFCPHWKKTTAGLLILISTMGIVWVVSTALISRQLPGFELLALLLLHWAGWLLRRPGWQNAIAQSWQHMRNWLAVYTLFFCTLILSLLWIYTHAQFQWWYLLPPAGAGMLLWTRRRYVPVVAWWVLAALALFSFRLDHWMYSVVGDEYIFLEYAETAALMPFIQLQRKLLNCCYVYGQHPFISSLFQAVLIKLTGSATFGWRIANPLLCALSLPFFFSFFKDLCQSYNRADRRDPVSRFGIFDELFQNWLQQPHCFLWAGPGAGSHSLGREGRESRILRWFGSGGRAMRLSLSRGALCFDPPAHPAPLLQAACTPAEGAPLCVSCRNLLCRQFPLTFAATTCSGSCHGYLLFHPSTQRIGYEFGSTHCEKFRACVFFWFPYQQRKPFCCLWLS